MVAEKADYRSARFRLQNCLLPTSSCWWFKLHNRHASGGQLGSARLRNFTSGKTKGVYVAVTMSWPGVKEEAACA